MECCHHYSMLQTKLLTRTRQVACRYGSLVDLSHTSAPCVNVQPLTAKMNLRGFKEVLVLLIQLFWTVNG